MKRWLSALVVGFVAGAGAITVADPGDHEPRVVFAPVQPVPAAINDRPVDGVNAQDIAVEAAPDRPLDPLTRAALRDQLVRARAVALRYPTVADAAAAGYVLAGGFAPRSGAHYVGAAVFDGAGVIDVERPAALIYDGTNQGSRVVGLLYGSSGGEAPEGFAGPNDHWHRHSNVCVRLGVGRVDVPFPADADVTEELCASVGGSLTTVSVWMVHAWVVPSWESPKGVFSHDHPNLRCPDGTYDTDEPPFCRGT